MVINMVLYTRRLDYDPIAISNHVIQLDTTFMSLIEEFNKIPFKVDMKLVYAHLNPDALDMIASMFSIVFCIAFLFVAIVQMLV